jgi:predicted O-methyltransferase YrrM
MSKDSTPVDAALFAFVRQQTIGEDAFLRDLKLAAAQSGLPEIHIAPEQAAFLQLLLLGCRARHVVEVGTLGGYSAIAMARGLPPEGRLITLELDPKHAEFARTWIARSDQCGKIDVWTGDARDTLHRIGAATADAVFLDADKEGYVDYLPHAMRILRPGGLLLADNVFASGEVHRDPPTTATARAIRAFLDAVASTKGLRSVMVPVGDGCLMGVKS